jgi:hypothetical protein
MRKNIFHKFLIHIPILKFFYLNKNFTKKTDFLKYIFWISVLYF